MVQRNNITISIYISVSAGTNPPSSQGSSPGPCSPSATHKSSPHQAGLRAKTPFRTRVTAIIESSGLVRGHNLHQPSQPSPPATDPLAKRVMAPAVPGSSEERGEFSEGQQEDQLRKTSSLTTFSPHQLTGQHLTRMGRDYNEKPLVLKLQPKLVESKESSVCSSVLSSMESVESNTSEGEKHELFITAGQLVIID